MPNVRKGLYYRERFCNEFHYQILGRARCIGFLTLYIGPHTRLFHSFTPPLFLSYRKWGGGGGGVYDRVCRKVLLLTAHFTLVPEATQKGSIFETVDGKKNFLGGGGVVNGRKSGWTDSLIDWTQQQPSIITL